GHVTGVQTCALPISLKNLIQEGLSADLLLLSGGVSMGKFDFVEQALADLNATFFFTGAHIQPGKPVVFGEASAMKGQRPVPFFRSEERRVGKEVRYR